MKTELSRLTLILAMIGGLGLSVTVPVEEPQAALKAQAKITQEEVTRTGDCDTFSPEIIFPEEPKSS